MSDFDYDRDAYKYELLMINNVLIAVPAALAGYVEDAANR